MLLLKEKVVFIFNMKKYSIILFFGLFNGALVKAADTTFSFKTDKIQDAFQKKDILYINKENPETESIIILGDKIENTEGMLSYSKMGEEQIFRLPGKNIGGLINIFPNVEKSGSVRGSNSEFKIRGLEDTRITTKIDGTKTNFRGEYKGRNFISPFMIKEITIKRGSNSVLEGSGAIAGSVNLETKNVEDIAFSAESKVGGETAASYSSNGNLQSYSGSAFARNYANSILAMYNFTGNRNFQMAQKTEVEGSGKKIIEETIPYSAANISNGFLKFKHKFNEVEFIQITSSVFTEKGESTSNPFRIANAGEPVKKNLINVRHSIETSLQKANIKAFYESVDIKEDSLNPLKPRLDVTGFMSYGGNLEGFFPYEKTNAHNIFTYGLEFIKDSQKGERPGDQRINLYPSGESRNEGVYLQNAMKIGKLSVLLGARQDYYNISATVNGKLEERKHASNILKKGVISYEAAPFFTPYIRYSEGYRSPLIKEAFASGEIVKVSSTRPGIPYAFKLDLKSNFDLKPEYSKNYESGFKLSSNDLISKSSAVSLSFNYFIQDIKDYIMQDPACKRGEGCTPYPTFFIFQYQNLSSIRLRGFESDLKYESEKIVLGISYSQTQGYEKSNGNPLLQIPGPKFVTQVSVKLNENLSIGGENILMGGVKKSRWYNIITDRGAIPTDAFVMQLAMPTKGYSLFNFNIDYMGNFQKSEVRIGLALQNAFNRTYQEQTSFIPGLKRNISVYGKIKSR